VLGGWQISGFAFLISGEPLTVTKGGAFRMDATRTVNLGGDFNADGTGGDRPNAPSSTLKMSGWNRRQFMDGILLASDFPLPAPGVNGNLGKGTVRGPGFAQVDMQLGKTWKFTESGRFNAKLQVDAFNAFNRVNLNNPSMALDSNTFGRSTSPRTPRLFQLGLRIGF
jgi:hypothetical protein